MNGIRAFGDLRRYWIVNGVPLIEMLTVSYAPHDWRACELPGQTHDIYVPHLRQLAADAAAGQELVDGDGNIVNPDPEVIVNRWLVESRAVTSAGEPVSSEVDLILEPEDPTTPIFFDPFKRRPRAGARQVTEEMFNAAVATIAERRQDENVRWAEEHIRLAQVKWDAMATAIGPDGARGFLGERPDLDKFLSTIGVR